MKGIWGVAVSAPFLFLKCVDILPDFESANQCRQTGGLKKLKFEKRSG